MIVRRPARFTLFQVKNCRARNGGFTLLEVMVSITLLFLGVVTAGAVMVLTEQGSLFTEDRYRDFTELRNRIESIKTAISSSSLAAASPALFDHEVFVAPSGHSGSARIESGASGIPNLVRVEMTVDAGEGAPPVRLVTYMKANETGNVSH